MDKYFPWGIAEGEAFLGRKAEIAHLSHNIKKGYHSLLLAPRRFGKTSLAKHTAHLLGYPWVEIDLFVSADEYSIEQKILKGVQTIISEIDKPDWWFNVLSNFFKQAQKTWTIGVKGFKLELIPENKNDVPDNILSALNALEYVLSKKKQRAILFIDEFQEIMNIKISSAIEGAIRHFAQKSKYVVFIFSGSSQHMLKHMFDNQSRPLYSLCDQIHLNRLQAQDYQNYLNKIARKTWGKNLDQKVFDKILQVTECHPRYVYYLCVYLWEFCKDSPRLVDVDNVWEKMLKDRIKDTREILLKRAHGQIKILSLIALGFRTELTGQMILGKLAMSGSAVMQSLKILIEDDYIEKLGDNSYRIIDPLLKSILARYGEDYFF